MVGIGKRYVPPTPPTGWECERPKATGGRDGCLHLSGSGCSRQQQRASRRLPRHTVHTGTSTLQRWPRSPPCSSTPAATRRARRAAACSPGAEGRVDGAKAGTAKNSGQCRHLGPQGWALFIGPEATHCLWNSRSPRGHHLPTNTWGEDQHLPTHPPTLNAHCSRSKYSKNRRFGKLLGGSTAKPTTQIPLPFRGVTQTTKWIHVCKHGLVLHYTQ